MECDLILTKATKYTNAIILSDTLNLDVTEDFLLGRSDPGQTHSSVQQRLLYQTTTVSVSCVINKDFVEDQMTFQDQCMLKTWKSVVHLLFPATVAECRVYAQQRSSV